MGSKNIIVLGARGAGKDTFILNVKDNIRRKTVQHNVNKFKIRIDFEGQKAGRGPTPADGQFFSATNAYFVGHGGLLFRRRRNWKSQRILLINSPGEWTEAALRYVREEFELDKEGAVVTEDVKRAFMQHIRNQSSEDMNAVIFVISCLDVLDGEHRKLKFTKQDMVILFDILALIKKENKVHLGIVASHADVDGAFDAKNIILRALKKSQLSKYIESIDFLRLIDRSSRPTIVKPVKIYFKLCEELKNEIYDEYGSVDEPEETEEATANAAEAKQGDNE
jgi:hypothetical protein